MKYKLKATHPNGWSDFKPISGIEVRAENFDEAVKKAQSLLPDPNWNLGDMSGGGRTDYKWQIEIESITEEESNETKR